MKEFQLFLNEGRKKVEIDTTKNGVSPGMLLMDFYNKFKDAEWMMKENVKITRNYSTGPTLLLILQRDGYIERNGKVFKITQVGLDYCTNKTPSEPDVEPEAEVDVEDHNLAKGVRDISKLKEKKFIVPKVGKNSKYLDQMKMILTHMEGFADGDVKTTYMLGGDPGTGKTSFIRSLSTLTGIPLVVIEAPHITQEHLINIPFLVIDGNKEKTGNLTIDETQMKVVQAESNLVTQLKSKKKRTPQQVMSEINRSKVLRDIYPLLKSRIDAVADEYNSILFLDEFYRTSSVKIRNVLRNILNGKIGNDRIPTGVYIIMATNINDEGVEDIPLNQDFHLMDYDISSKSDFMNYVYGKYVSNPEEGHEPTSDISVKPEVWNKFMEVLTDQDLGFNSEEADVRLSPRRLEQMIIYIDAALPVRGEDDARNLLAFVKTNLSNYLTGKNDPELLEKFNKIVTDIIEESSPEIDIDRILNTPMKKSQWRDQLQHEIEMKIKLGENRKYVPVVSGHPGIGKTSQMAEIGNNLNMGFIQIDVSSLTPEDITGMPIAKVGKEITTEFSEPNLYITIMRDYNEMIGDFREEGRKYNIILLFDELNRASVPVFNSIRKVLLEREFENVKLPDDIMITGAINPTDIGAIEFTSHTRDVLDIIPSAGNFFRTIEYIKTKPSIMKRSDKLGFDLGVCLTDLMSGLALEFQSEVDTDDNEIDDVDVRPFWWNAGGQVIYVSPREMTECVANTALQISAVFREKGWDLDQRYDEKEFEFFIDEAVNVSAKTFVDSFNMITLKQELVGFAASLGKKISTGERYRKMFDIIKTKKSANVMSLFTILGNAGWDIDFLDKSVMGNYIKDFSSTDLVQDVALISDKFMGEGSSNIELVKKIIKLYERLSISLGKINATNIYTDQLNKYVGEKIVSIIENTDLDIVELLKDDVLMSKLETLL